MRNRVLGCAITAALFSVSPLVASAAEYVELFDATPVTESGGNNGLVGNEVDIGKTWVFESVEKTVYCATGGTGYVVSDDGDGSYSGPLVDNYMTLGEDDDVSICTGSDKLPTPVSGSRCFSGVKSSRVRGEPMANFYEAIGITAPVPLVAGQNELTFNLWDYGVDYGNNKLVLELPENCTANPPLFLDVKPQSFPNAVNICSNGVIPIAIAGSEVLPLDGYTVKSVNIGDEFLETFGKAGKDNCAFEDVVTFGQDIEGFNPDGYGDYVCHIPAVTFRDAGVDESVLTVLVTLTNGISDVVFELDGSLKQTKLNCL